MLFFKKKNTMKYWICKDSEGIFLYWGSKAPKYNEETKKFESVEDLTDKYDWIESNILDLLPMKYPQDMEEGVCFPIRLKIKASW